VLRGLFQHLNLSTTPTVKSDRKPPQAPKPTKSRSKVRVSTVLGTDARFEGSLRSDGDVTLENIFVGDINASGNVKLGADASLTGNLVCDRAVIAGVVKGNITARSITVLDTGRVIGDLRMERLITEDNAFFQGVITLEEKINPDVVIAEAVQSKVKTHIPTPVTAKTQKQRVAVGK
jgi:cytoskeletal protein CcmA (bactofilin family)